MASTNHRQLLNVRRVPQALVFQCAREAKCERTTRVLVHPGTITGGTLELHHETSGQLGECS